VELALPGVRDLAGLVEAHEAGGEHLGVDAEVAGVAVGEEVDHHRRDPADPGLERRAGADVRVHVAGDRRLDVRRGCVGQQEGHAVALDDEVDLIDVHPVRELGRDPQRAREVRGDLHDHDPVGVGDRALQLVPGRPRVERQAHPPVPVRRGDRSREDARVERLDDGGEAAEVGRDELDRGADVAEQPLGRAEEPGEQPDARLGEERIQVDEQRAEDVELLEVVALAERVEELGGLAGSERDRQAVAWPDGRDRGGEIDDGHAAYFSIPDSPPTQSKVPNRRASRVGRRVAGPGRRPQLVERALEHRDLLGVEAVEHLPLQVLERDRERLVELPLPGAAQHGPLDAAILRAGLALDEPGPDHAVDEAGRAPARQPELLGQVAHREATTGGAAEPQEQLEEDPADPRLALERAVERPIEAAVRLVEQPERVDPGVLPRLGRTDVTAAHGARVPAVP
jgi:hypothetical protein